MIVKRVKAISIVKFPPCPITCPFSQSFLEPWCCKTLSEVLVVCMSKEVPLEELTKRFQSGGIEATMVAMPKKPKFIPKQTRQSPRTKVPQSEVETSSRSAPLVPAYDSLQAPGAPIIELAKQVKYVVPLPPMPEEVREQGNLLGKIDQLKFQDYNLKDPQKFPQFQVDQYLVVREDSVTKKQILALQPWIEVLESSGLLNLLRIPHFR